MCEKRLILQQSDGSASSCSFHAGFCALAGFSILARAYTSRPLRELWSQAPSGHNQLHFPRGLFGFSGGFIDCDCDLHSLPRVPTTTVNATIHSPLRPRHLIQIRSVRFQTFQILPFLAIGVWHLKLCLFRPLLDPSNTQSTAQDPLIGAVYTYHAKSLQLYSHLPPTADVRLLKIRPRLI